MPLYEYECDACGHRFEVIRKFSDAPIETCPKCGGRVRKLFASPAIQFKGSGWYITDYARKPEAAKGEKATSDSGAKDASSTTEAAGMSDKLVDASTTPPSSGSSSAAKSSKKDSTTS